MLSRMFFLLGAMLLVQAGAAQACPGCNGALNGDLGYRINASILFMMAMPFTVAGSVAACIIFLYRKTSPTPASPKRESQNTEEAEN